MIRALQLAPVLLVLCYSYSYSEDITGLTNNAAANGLNWDMSNVLPPQAGLTVGGIVYSYTVDKELEDAFLVTVQNEDLLSDGYVLQYTDDWTGLNGNSLIRQYPLNSILGDRIGEGSITTEGTGSVSDANVRYSYKYDDCYDPMAKPECPGYAEAYLAYLFDNGLINLNGPDYDPLAQEGVADALDNSGEPTEEQEALDAKEEDEEEEEELELLLSIRDDADEIASKFAQEQMLMALNDNLKLAPYIEKLINGGLYDEVVELQDKKINDNRSAAVRMGLAQDLIHDKIVASQYD